MRIDLRSVAIAALLFVGVAGAPIAASAGVPSGELWVKRYDGPRGAFDAANALVVSDDGTTVFVTGESQASSGADDVDYATVAYDATSGNRLWVRWYEGPGDPRDIARAMDVSPDGTTLFVTGRSGGSTPGPDFATVAYDVATGATVWVRRYDGPGRHGRDAANAIGVSPDGTRVFVTGRSMGSGGAAYATLAYAADTGTRLWVERYDGPDGRPDAAQALAVIPDGRAVAVTGVSEGVGHDFATLAYDADTGARLWVTRYDGPDHGSDLAADVGVSPNGAGVFTTGYSTGGNHGAAYTTVAYEADSGAERWATRYDGPADLGDAASALVVSPDGAAVFVTGFSSTTLLDVDYATVGYDSATGEELWATRYDGPANGNDLANAIGMSPDGSRVVVTGVSVGPGTDTDYATLTYDAAGGDELGAFRYDGPRGGHDTGSALGVGPDGARVFVTGYSAGPGSSRDYATVAYGIPWTIRET